MLINNQIQNRVNFGYKVYVDLGASNPNGTIKFAIKSDDGKQILYSSDNAKDLKREDKIVCPNGIINNQDYINGIIKKVCVAINVCKDQISKLADEKDRFLSGILFCIPGTVEKDNHVHYFKNLKYKDKNKINSKGDDSLVNLSFDKDAIEAYEGFSEIETNGNYKVVAVNDSMGCLASVAKYIAANKPELLLDPGKQIAAAIIGGGFAFPGIEVNDDDNLEFKTSQYGGMRAVGSSPANMYTYQDMASVPGLITNYLKALGLNTTDNENCKELIKLGNAQIVTNYHIEVKKDSWDYKKLKETGLFKEEISQKDLDEKEAPDTVTLSLKDVSENQHKKAAWDAVNKFVDATGQLCAIRVATSYVNSIFLVGPLVEGIDKFIRENPEEGKERTNLSDLVKADAEKKVATSLTGIMERREFDISIIPGIKSNIDDADPLLNDSAKVVDKNLIYWMRIPKRALNLTETSLAT